LYFFYDSYGNLASIRCFTGGKEYVYYTATNMAEILKENTIRKKKNFPSQSSSHLKVNKNERHRDNLCAFLCILELKIMQFRNWYKLFLIYC